MTSHHVDHSQSYATNVTLSINVNLSDSYTLSTRLQFPVSSISNTHPQFQIAKVALIVMKSRDLNKP